MLSNSIEERAIKIAISNPSIDMLDAVRQAINEENKLIEEMVSGDTDRAKMAKGHVMKNVYCTNVLKS